MKTVKVVFYASGENSGTYDPKCFLENFTGDLTAKTSKFVSWDCNIDIEVDMFQVREIEMPEWMTEWEYLDKHIDLKYALGLGMPKDFNKIQFNNFIQLSEKYKFFIGWLYKKHSKSKNAFMQSILSQVSTWLKSESNKYGQPLSMAQFEAASRFCPLWEAKQISNSLYWSR